MNRHTTALDILEFIFWSLEKLSQPTFRNLTESFEGWEYRVKIRPHLHRLARTGFVEMLGAGSARTVALTDRGRLLASGGVDVAARWRRSWDGKWRLLVFDIPGQQAQLRMRLWRWLRTQRLGYLQQSVWASPDPVDDRLLPLKHLKLTPELFMVIEGRPVAPDTDADIVRGAWDFVAINRAYDKVIQLCDEGRDLARRTNVTPAQRLKWLAAQRQAWSDALWQDPLLPEPLWSANYAGPSAWKARKEAFDSLLKLAEK